MRHKCEYYDTDKMMDVVISGRHFKCKCCGKILSDEQVDQELIPRIEKNRPARQVRERR